MKGIAVIIGLNLVALFGIFIFFKRRIDKSLGTDEIVEQVRGEIEQLLVELNQTTSRNVEIIEERIRQLKETTIAAERQIKVLNRELDKKAKESDTYTRIKPAVKPQPEPNINPGGEEKSTTREKVLSMFHMGSSPDLISKELGITLAEVELIISLDSKRG